tara:strand:+ start:806 stop:1063 length:258 start_codon:yes stop_codon:yes gene_type:complete
METTLKYEFVNDQDGVMVFYFDSVYTVQRKRIEKFMRSNGYEISTHYTLNAATGDQRARLPGHSYSVAAYFCNPEDFVMMKISHG